jgi:preprotein translocase subunit SecY
MLDKLQNVFRVPELKRRIGFTAALLIVYRLGGHVPTPGIDSQALATIFEQQKNTLFGLYDMFVGGSFRKATVFALGIMPYISAAIILQLMGAVVPYFQKLQKEGEEGRKKIQQLTRYGTVLLSMIQSYGIAIYLERATTAGGISVVAMPGWTFRLFTMITLTSGTIFVMWLGEQISERGIGNGISLIIFIGIVARFPNDILNTVRAVISGQLQLFAMIAIGVLMVLIIASVVLMTQGQRKIPVQYAKRVVGRKMYGGQSTHIPLRVNAAGVMPIIFAQSIIMIPGTAGTFFQGAAGQPGMAGFLSDLMLNITALFNPRGPWAPFYYLIYSIIIIFFTYFYTAIVLNPEDLADNMKKYGGFIPGVRPGRRTSEYIDRVLTRITLPGAVFLALIAIVPDVFINYLGVPFYFGGTGLLIVVGVALDTLQQVESHLVMRHYEGFLRRGRLRGRRFG